MTEKEIVLASPPSIRTHKPANVPPFCTTLDSIDYLYYLYYFKFETVEPETEDYGVYKLSKKRSFLTTLVLGV
jgi:hypothetical protein